MSADNWADCPRCRNRGESERNAKLAALPKLYGQIPAEEYLEEVKKAEQPPDWQRSTFREDYEVGVSEEGGFYVEYQGRCTFCGLTHKFSHAETIYRPGEDDGQ